MSESYFEWLISQISVRNNKTYMGVFEALYRKEFHWIVANDDNRIADGKALRLEYARGSHPTFQDGVSTLEVLVALSRRCAFLGDGSPEGWAWHLMENLRLHKCADPFTKVKAIRTDNILDALIWRLYQRNGVGGFFPIAWNPEDQTKVEIWYQMNYYISEMPEEL